MAKDLRFNVEARQLLEAGVNALADAIKITLGPKGRNAIIEKMTGAPTITNDGVTIAREIHLGNPFANMGAQLVKEVAMKTDGAVGDGTTTATVLAQALVREGLRAVDAGANPMALRRGIETSVAAVVSTLQSRSVEIGGQSDLMSVATLSASDDTQIGQVVSDALGRVGLGGVVNVEESDLYGLSLSMVDGVEFDHGFISPYMVTDKERMEASFDNPFILLTNKKISAVQDLMPALELVMRHGKGRALIILAENIDGAALSMLVSNNVHDTFKSVVIRAPGFGHRRVAELEDLAALLGGSVVSDDSGVTLASLKLSDLGSCSRIVVTENGTTMIGGAGQDTHVTGRLAQLRRELERTVNEHDRDNIQLRIARLANQVAVIHVGAATGVEMKEKMHRVEDSLSATRAALEEGVLAGGGTALLHARASLDDVVLVGDAAEGREVVRRALSEPLRWIAINAGYDGDEIIRTVSELPIGHGFNALTGEYGDMFDFGVMDPLKVTRSALQAASSIAALLITTETAIVEEVFGQAGSIYAPGFGDLAEGMVRPSNIY
jgi:chaperonin GroEL